MTDFNEGDRVRVKYEGTVEASTGGPLVVVRTAAGSLLGVESESVTLLEKRRPVGQEWVGKQVTWGIGGRWERTLAACTVGDEEWLVITYHATNRTPSLIRAATIGAWRDD